MKFICEFHEFEFFIRKKVAFFFISTIRCDCNSYSFRKIKKYFVSKGTEYLRCFIRKCMKIKMCHIHYYFKLPQIIRNCISIVKHLFQSLKDLVGRIFSTSRCVYELLNKFDYVK